MANLLTDDVSVIDASGGGAPQTISAGDGAYDVAVDRVRGYLYVSDVFADTVHVIPLQAGIAGLGARPAPATATVAASAALAEEPPLARVLLAGFPAGGRASVDGEFPRAETLAEAGLEIGLAAGSCTLFLACPDCASREMPVSLGPGEYVTLDGSMGTP